MARTWLDGIEITNIVRSGTSSHWLNRKWQATADILVEDYDPSFFTDGARLAVTDVDGANGPDFNGFLKLESAEDGEDADGTVTITAESPRELWEWRPARDGPLSPGGAAGDLGDFSLPSFFQLGNAPSIMEDILLQSMDDSDPADGEGDLFIVIGSVPSGGVDLSGAQPSDWPMMIEEIAQTLTSTGELDIVEVPHAPSATGPMATVNFYHGNYGTDLSGSVEFNYATGSHNVKQIRRTRDRTKECNKLWYYLGPKLDDQHWRRSITGGAIIAGYPEWAGIDALRMLSRSRVGVRMDIRVMDSLTNESEAAPLYERLFLDESMWRAQPRQLLNVTPVDGLDPTFDIGDIIGIEYGARFLGGDSVIQRVYGRKVSWDEDGVASIAEITSSEDGDAA